MTDVATVDIEHAPMGSVASHGSGGLAVLRTASAAMWIVRLLEAASVLVKRGAETAAERLQVLGNHLVALPPADSRARLEDPAVAAWLARLWRQISTPEIADQTELSQHVDAATWLFLRDHQQLCDASAWSRPVELPHIGVAPAGVQWRLSGGPSLSQRVSVVPSAEGLTLTAQRRQLCAIRWEALQPGSDSVPIELAGPELVHAAQRCFLLNGAVEVLDDTRYPELSERRTRDEIRSPLSVEELEIELTAALAVIESIWPAAVPDVRALFRGLLPIAMSGERWNSASTGELPFVLQLTFRAGGWPFLLADSLLHETSHSKLDMAMALTPLLLNDNRKLYRHPWRPDLRPLVGVLLGAHAFLAVMQLYAVASQAFPGDQAIRQQWTQRQEEVGSALATLNAHARFTPAGETVYRDMLAVFEGARAGVLR